MSNRNQIEQRVKKSAQKILQAQDYVAPIDVLIDMGLLQMCHVKDWRKGKLPNLEKVISCNLAKLNSAMNCFRIWANRAGLKPSETVYLMWKRGPKKELRFSKSGNEQIELAYRTHYISPKLSERKQQKLKEKLEQSPEVIVYIIVKDSQCSGCQQDLMKGSFLLMDADNPLCLNCAGLSDLFFLPSGDAKLTRTAKKYSSKFAVVVKFSRARKRYERQGILVEESALEKARTTQSTIRGA